jgi:DNA-binding Xre family transcriptional regulator
MARYNVKAIDLAKEMGVSNNAVSNLRKADTMPRIDGETLNKICFALQKLSRTSVTVSDLVEFLDDEVSA